MTFGSPFLLALFFKQENDQSSRGQYSGSLLLIEGRYYYHCRAEVSNYYQGSSYNRFRTSCKPGALGLHLGLHPSLRISQPKCVA